MYNLLNEIIKNIYYIMRKHLLNLKTMSNASELIGNYLIDPILVITTNGSNLIPGSIKKITSSIYYLLCIKVQLILNTLNTSIHIIQKIYNKYTDSDHIHTPTKIVPLQEIPKNTPKKTQKVKEIKKHPNQKQPIISVENLPQITFDKNITDMNPKYHSSNTEGNIRQMIHNINYISLHQNKYLQYITKIHIIKGIHPTKSKPDHFTAFVTCKSQHFRKLCHFNINNTRITDITYKFNKNIHIVKCTHINNKIYRVKNI